MKRLRKSRQLIRSLPKVENPELFLAWVYVVPPAEYDAPRRRGGPVFEALRDMGMRVQVIPQGGMATMAVRGPWTVMFAAVPEEDFSAAAESLVGLNCSVIMDCPFPIMDMTKAIGSEEAIGRAIENMDTLLANLALADVVTVPHPRWAEQLAEINSNVHVLPDYEDDHPERFALRLQEMAQVSIRVKQARQRAHRGDGQAP